MSICSRKWEEIALVAANRYLLFLRYRYKRRVRELYERGWMYMM